MSHRPIQPPVMRPADRCKRQSAAWCLVRDTQMKNR